MDMEGLWVAWGFQEWIGNTSISLRYIFGKHILLSCYYKIFCITEKYLGSLYFVNTGTVLLFNIH